MLGLRGEVRVDSREVHFEKLEMEGHPHRRDIRMAVIDAQDCSTVEIKECWVKSFG